MPSALAVYSGVSKDTWTWLCAAKLTDFRRLGYLDNSNEVRRVGEIAVMEEEANVFAVPILIEMIDALGVE